MKEYVPNARLVQLNNVRCNFDTYSFNFSDIKKRMEDKQ